MVLRLCLALALLIAAMGTAEAASTCKSGSTPTISVKTEPHQVTYDQAMSRDQILAFARRLDPAAGKGYDGVLGITDSRNEWRLEYGFLSQELPTGDTCVWFNSIAVVVTWRSAVHVASELKPGSCMYKVVLEHEQGHVDIDRNAMGYGQGLIEKAVATIEGSSVKAATADAGIETLKQRALTKLRAAFKILNDDVDRRQKAHDTPEEYAKPAKICGIEENNRALGD